MSRINTNVSSLIAQRVLRQNNDNTQKSLERLSTGVRINRGSDNPAGLIASENLRSEITGIRSSIENATRATNIISTAEGGLNEVSALLIELQTLVGTTANTAGLSQEEISANQLQVDSILSTVNRLADATAFGGRKLLNGALDYRLSGVATSAFDSVRINAPRITEGSTQQVVVELVTSAQVAAVNITSTAANPPLTIEISGSLGSQQLSFGSSTTNASIRDAINAVASVTGVSAVTSGANLRINSTEFGSAQFVTVRAISGNIGTITQGTSDSALGRDAEVRVNGALASADGLDVTFRSGNLDAKLKLNQDFNTNGLSQQFFVTGGGADFALGTKVTEGDRVSLGIGSVSTASLGDASEGFLSTLASGGVNSLSSKNFVSAQRILDESIRQISQLRGRLGAFVKYTLDATIRSQGIALENALAAESAIRDTDFASETSALTRSQILSQSASTVLAQANSQPQSVLSLLQG